MDFGLQGNLTQVNIYQILPLGSIAITDSPQPPIKEDKIIRNFRRKWCDRFPIRQFMEKYDIILHKS